MIDSIGYQRNGIADLDDTVGLIYEAALDPALWPVALSRITNQSRATSTFLLILEPSTARPVHLLFDQWPGYDEYVRYYASIDPRNAHGARLKAGAKVVDYDFITEPEMGRSEFYQDYLLPNGLGYVGGEMFAQDAGCVAAIAVQRSRCQGPFSRRELDILDRLAPHLLRALRVQTRFAELQGQLWANSALLDRLPYAVLLVDARGRIVAQNQAATDLLAAGDGLTARQGRLRACHAADQATLDRLIRDAAPATTASGVPAGGAVALRRPSLRRPLHAFVMPIPRNGAAFSLNLGASAPAALVIVTDPEAAPQAPAAVLQRLYGLTPAEAAMAAALAAGKSLKEHADEARLTTETARWRLKQVLAKTDTHRQAELVRLLLTSTVLGR